MDASRLRPLRVGEVIDVAIKVYRQRFGDLARAVAVVVIPVNLLNILVTLSMSDLDEPDPFTGTELGEPTPTFDGGEIATFVGGFVIVGLLSWLATQLATAACFDIVSGTYLDREPTWRESLRFALRKLRSLTWLEILYVLGLGLGFVLCVIPGIYLYVAWTVAVPVLLFEDLRGRRALGRSRRLLKGRWWPTAAVLLLVFILSGILASVIQGVLLAAVSSSDSDLVAAIGNGIAQAGAAVLTTPFGAAISTVLYYDALVRKEAFDLQQLAAGFGVDPADLPEVEPVGIIGEDGDEPPFWPPPPGWRPSR